VAVNTDKDAPIFEAANYGVVGDVHKVLPELITAIREMKAS
jgi:electron transfer flavoprotein alpha subunit